MMLSLDTAYRSFSGEVEASSTPTICRLSDSSRHQLSAIAPSQHHRRIPMADKKVVFVAFAIEDEKQRDLLKGQSLHPRAPYEFIDMSVKEAYDSGWKDKVRTRIRRSAGVIVLVSKNSKSS